MTFSLRLAGLALVFLAVLVPRARAQTPEITPPAPTTQKEWLRLKSGEWLRGEIKSMRKERLEFESDELDNLDLDWEDVTEIISPVLHTYVFGGRRILVGTAVMKGGKITINTDSGTEELEARELVSVTSGLMRRRDHWSGSGSLHIVSRSGNTNQNDVTTIFRLRRAAALTRFQLDYSGTIGEVNGDRNVNTHNTNAAIDVYLSQRFFVTLASLDLFSDEFQNIALRVSPGAGVGYLFLNKKRIEFEVGLGVGLQWTRFGSVEEGEDETIQQTQVTPNIRLETEVTKAIDWDLNFDLRIGLPDTQQSFIHLFTTLSFDLTDAWDFEAAFTWDRVVTPTADSEGNLPEQDDYRFSYGLNVDF